MEKTVSLHEERIRALVEDIPSLQRESFIKAINEILEADEDFDDLDHPVFKTGPIPDAYVIDHKSKHVAIFEVVVSNPISPKKMHIYSDIGELLWEAGYDFFIFEVDKFGGRNLIHHLEWYLDATVYKRPLAECGARRWFVEACAARAASAL